MLPLPKLLILIARLRIDQPDADELFRMRKRKPAQHDRVDHRELRHRAADAEREHEDGEKAERLCPSRGREDRPGCPG